MLPRETVLVPTFWEEYELCGDDGREGLMWLGGTEAERELIRKRDEGLGLVSTKKSITASPTGCTLRSLSSVVFQNRKVEYAR